MKEFMAVIGVFLLVLLLVVAGLGLGWLGRANNLAEEKVFAPREEAVRREVFEQSKAYRQGQIQELQNMAFQYEQADEDHKGGLASIILRRMADFNDDDLPSDLRQFVSKLRRQKLGGK